MIAADQKPDTFPVFADEKNLKGDKAPLTEQFKLSDEAYEYFTNLDVVMQVLSY